MGRRAQGLMLLLVGLVVGSCGTLVPTMASPGGPPVKGPWQDCRGNGAGGFRACDIYMTGKVDKVSYRLFINGKEQLTMLYYPNAGRFDPKIVQK